MSSLQSKYSSLVKSLSEDRQVNKSTLQTITAQYNSSKLTLEEAIERLESLQEMPFFHGDPSWIQDEWKQLADTIKASEDRIKQNTMWQMRVGIISVPLYIIIVLLGVFFGLFSKEIHIMTLPIIGAVLVALIIHTFYILRTQQQSTIAMERLAEKRLGIMFMKLASGSDPKGESFKQLVDAGVKMFLEHHAPAAIVLSPEDAKAVASQLSHLGSLQNKADKA